MGKHVLVTGGNGHVGFNLVQHLVESGYTVRATVRDLKDPLKVAHLEPLGVELVQADVLLPDTLAQAMDGIDGVFQVAAAYRLVSKANAAAVLEPSLIGGPNVLRAAAAAGVKKVVFTSSVAAVGGAAPGQAPKTEADWNDDTEEPYSQAKTRGERAAWQVAEECGLKLVTINPTAVLGPGFYRHTPSTRILALLAAGRMPMALPFEISLIDARDVARAHRLAFENDGAEGRYIVAGEEMSVLAFCKIVKKLDPSLKVPRRAMPEAMLWSVPMMDQLMHLVLRTPRSTTREFLAELKGKNYHVSTDKIRAELGWAPAFSTEDTLMHTINWIREHEVAD